MDVAVGVGRAVMQHELWPAGRGLAQPAVEIVARPARQNFRLALGQAGSHRKRGLGQKQRLRIVAGLARGLGGFGHGRSQSDRGLMGRADLKGNGFGPGRARRREALRRRPGG